MTNSNPVRHTAVEQLYDAVELQKNTVEKLRQNGHIHTDAERYLNQLKDRLEYSGDARNPKQ